MSLLTIGHRGLRNEYPENTLQAIRSAARHVPCIEIDIRRCGSGELVVVHDDSLEELTGFDYTVSNTDLEILETLPVLNTEHTIPSFEEVLEAWPARTGINVDVKGDDPTVVEEVNATIARAAIDEPHIVSVDQEMLNLIDPDALSIPTGLSFWKNPAFNVRMAADRGCAYVHVYYQLCLETDLIEHAHKLDLAVDAWSVDDVETIDRLETVGVDAVTVDSISAIGDHGRADR